jgi:hypothetical protein
MDQLKRNGAPRWLLVRGFCGTTCVTTWLVGKISESGMDAELLKLCDQVFTTGAKSAAVAYVLVRRANRSSARTAGRQPAVRQIVERKSLPSSHQLVGRKILIRIRHLVLGPSLTAKLRECAIGGAVGGITEAVTLPEARTLPEAGAGYSTAAGDDGGDHDACSAGRLPSPAPVTPSKGPAPCWEVAQALLHEARRIERNTKACPADLRHPHR